MTHQEFVTMYSAKNMYAYAMYEERCHIGDAPRIGEALKNYGMDAVAQVIHELLEHFQMFTSAREKYSQHQHNALIWIICTQYPHMRITELHLFFVKAMAGKFGKFYDRLEPMDITAALDKWQEECVRQRAKYIEKKIKEDDWKEREAYHSVWVAKQKVIKFE